MLAGYAGQYRFHCKSNANCYATQLRLNTALGLLERLNVALFGELQRMPAFPPAGIVTNTEPMYVTLCDAVVLFLMQNESCELTCTFSAFGL